VESQRGPDDGEGSPQTRLGQVSGGFIQGTGVEAVLMLAD
jgi:hypothetical protein